MNAKTALDVLTKAATTVALTSPIGAGKLRMIAEAISGNQYLFDLMLQMNMQSISGDESHMINIQAVEGSPAVVTVIKNEGMLEIFTQSQNMDRLINRVE